MKSSTYDLIVIGAGSGGLSVALFMVKVGLKVLIIDKSDKNIGGDCLNYGCVPSKALIHISRILHQSREASQFGYNVSGNPDISKVMDYVLSRQNIIRKHENVEYLRSLGLEVVLGSARFDSSNSIKVGTANYTGKKIVLATGSRPSPLTVPGIENVKQYNNETIFTIGDLPSRLLIVGGGPIGIEMGQALYRLGAKVTILQRQTDILPHDDGEITHILYDRLKEEGIEFIVDSEVKEFINSNEAIIINKNGPNHTIQFDGVFVATGRYFELDLLDLEKAGIAVKNDKIVVNKYLQTTNKNVYTCGDIAGTLQFSHAAEQHARLLIHNFFSPFKKKLSNDHMSWVTFSDPEVATFGLNQTELSKRKILFEKLTMEFDDDDRAIIKESRYGKLILYIKKGNLFRKQKILGGTMIAPEAGELIQELILANSAGISAEAIFNKIYPYPVASRVNQKIIVNHKAKRLTRRLKGMLLFVYRLIN